MARKKNYRDSRWQWWDVYHSGGPKLATVKAVSASQALLLVRKKYGAIASLVAVARGKTDPRTEQRDLL